MKIMEIKVSNKLAALIFALVILVSGAGTYLVMDGSSASDSSDNASMLNDDQSATQISITQDGQIVSYAGVEGETALATLKKLTDVRVQTTDYGELVTGIGMINADSSKNFWGFYVNGKMAQVGAGDYVAKKGDQLEWRLTELR
jgi:hypothetical protein